MIGADGRTGRRFRQLSSRMPKARRNRRNGAGFGILVLTCCASIWGQPSDFSVPACLSLSPFRALPSLDARLPDPETARNQVLEAWKSRRGPDWIMRAAGTCPEGMPVLDVFQVPTDILRSPDGPVLRFRMEWRHMAGPTEFFVSCPHSKLPRPDSLASQLFVVAQQMVARIDLESSPDRASLRIPNLPDTLFTPLLLKTPPGAFSVSFLHDGMERRKDTLVASAGLYEIRADFLPTRIRSDPGAEIRRPTWPAWALTAVAVVAAGVMEWRQEKAQRAYSRLGAGESSDRFDQAWSDLRSANVQRNVAIGLTLFIGAGTSWWEWGRSR